MEKYQNVNADRMIDRPVYGDMMHVIITQWLDIYV